MKGSRAVIMLVLALIAGVAAVVLAGRWLTDQASTATSKVAVVSRDVNLGEPLNPTMVELVAWPASALPKGTFADLKALDGRVLITSLTRGEPVLESKLAAIGTKGGLSAVIPSGKRAITVKVNEVVGVAGFALPGNHVDVMVNTQDERHSNKMISKIVLEQILVLAVAQEAGRDDTKPKVVSAVTLEVTPEQAERLDLARSVGNLSLVLRNQLDKDLASTSGVYKDELLGKQPEVAPAPPPVVASAPPRRVVRSRPKPPQAPPETTVEVIRGVQRSDAKF